VRLTEGAVEDLQALHAWIVHQRSKNAADRWLANLMQAMSGLQTFPRRHPVGRSPGASWPWLPNERGVRLGYLAAPRTASFDR